MRPAIRNDREGVSPVIATILLVAITVVLAAVLYVMVSGLLTPVGNGPQIMGVALSKTGDGKNWSLEIASTPLGLTPGSVHLELISPGKTWGAAGNGPSLPIGLSAGRLSTMQARRRP